MDHRDHLPLWFYFLFALLGCPLSMWGCPDHGAAREILTAEGYEQISTEAWHGWSCGQDGRATGFRAINANGHRVRGVVCSGVWTKAYTVRLEAVER